MSDHANTAAQANPLQPIAWGKPDRRLARIVCEHMIEANPPTVIRFNPIKAERLRSMLRSLQLAY